MYAVVAVLSHLTHSPLVAEAYTIIGGEYPWRMKFTAT